MTGTISLFWVVFKNKQMEYIKQNPTELNKIKGLSSIRFGNRTHWKVWVQFRLIAEYNQA